MLIRQSLPSSPSGPVLTLLHVAQHSLSSKQHSDGLVRTLEHVSALSPYGQSVQSKVGGSQINTKTIRRKIVTKGKRMCIDLVLGFPKWYISVFFKKSYWKGQIHYHRVNFVTNRPSVISHLGSTCPQLSRRSHNTCSHKGSCSTGTAFRPLSVRTSSPGRRISPAYPHAHNLLKIQLKCIKLTIRTIFYDL